MTLRELFEQYGVTADELLATPVLPTPSLADRRAHGSPAVHVEASLTLGALEVTLYVPLFDGKARGASSDRRRDPSPRKRR